MTTPVLAEGQFSLDGITFGGPGDAVTILPGGWDRGSRDVQAQDRPMPSRDGLAFGRDTVSAPTWTFSLAVHDDRDSLPLLRRMRALWDARAVRSTPGALQALYFREGDETRVVYGRCRSWSEAPMQHLTRRAITITASFQLAEPVSHAGVESRVRLALNTTRPPSGIRFPLRFPVTFGQQVSAREGFALVSSETAGSPFTLTVQGPVTGAATNISLTAIPRGTRDGIYRPSWTFTLPGVTVSAGQTLIVDTGTGIVTKDGRAIVVGVGARAALRSRLFAGSTELTFKASDPSATAIATLTWRDTQPA